MKKLSILSPFELRVYIEFLRNDLINKAQELGLNSDQTVFASQELDYFIYQYQLLTAPRLVSQDY